MAVSRLSIVKFLELALACACVAIHYHSYNSDPDIGMLVTGTFVGYLIIFAGAAAGYMMQTVTHKRVDIFYSLVGVALYVAAAPSSSTDTRTRAAATSATRTWRRRRSPSSTARCCSSTPC
ncbi:unnamed protein product [Plutella xylostella]|uniref:(diamondback moth) hypothetical protein n=1 Tax=Plutella xylostella TaxID=51655 RepID=A0A8S4G9F1_PLUXY|nr:unnamed protein product [Plutella xylostella]